MRALGDRDDTRAQHSLSSAFEVPHDDRAPAFLPAVLQIYSTELGS